MKSTFALFLLLAACSTTPQDVLALQQCARSCPNGLAEYQAGGWTPASCKCAEGP